MGFGLAGLAAGLGAGLQGYAKGVQIKSDLDDAEQRRKLALEQSERDKERLKLEQSREAREGTRFGYEEADLKRRAGDANLEDEAKRELMTANGILNGAVAAPQPASPQAIANPMADQSAPMVAPANQSVEQAIATPGSPTNAASTNGAPKGNPFITHATGKDLDAAYDMSAKALQKFWIAKGDMDKALQVPKMMQELRAQNWSHTVGATLSSMATNAPGAREAFGKVYGMVNDGWDLDTKSGTYDPKTKTWLGLVRVNKDTGERESFDMSQTDAAVLAQRYKDPAAVIQYVQSRQDLEKSQEFEGRKVKATESQAESAQLTAKAHMKSADAAMIKANADKTYANNLTNAKTESEAYSTFSNMFGVKDFQVKTDNEVKALLPKEREAYENARAQQQLSRGMANAASTIWNINDKRLSASVVAQAVQEVMSRRSKGMGPDGVDAKTGLPYITFGGKQVLLPKE